MRYRSEDICHMIGITPRQLQTWDEKGLIKATREKWARYYSRDQIPEFLIAAKLREHGYYPLKRVESLLVAYRRRKRYVGEERFAVTDGRVLVVADSAESAFRWAATSDRPITLIDLNLNIFDSIGLAS